MASQRLSRKIKETVRFLRKEQTEAEEKLWQALRNRQLEGKKFLRQHPIVFDWEGKERFLVADFYCAEAKLVIEVDGPIHEKQKDFDQIRTEMLESLGLRVMRLKNSEVLDQLPLTLSTIKANLKEVPKGQRSLTEALLAERKLDRDFILPEK